MTQAQKAYTKWIDSGWNCIRTESWSRIVGIAFHAGYRAASRAKDPLRKEKDAVVRAAMMLLKLHDESAWTAMIRRCEKLQAAQRKRKEKR